MANVLKRYTLRRLVCGANGSGYASLLEAHNIEQYGGSALIQSILFNCGDSTQQACLQNHIKLNRLDAILFTSLSPHNISGLVGILLALSDLGSEKITLIGPPGLSGIVSSSSGYFRRRYPKITVEEIGEYPCTNVGIKHRHSICNLDIEVIPVWPLEGDLSFAIGSAFVLPSLDLGIFPADMSLATNPSLIELAGDIHCKPHPLLGLHVRTVLLFPLTVSALLFDNLRVRSHVIDVFDRWSTSNTQIFLNLTSPDACIVEFPRSQEAILFNSIVLPELFPRPFPRIMRTFATPDNNVSLRDADEGAALSLHSALSGQQISGPLIIDSTLDELIILTKQGARKRAFDLSNEDCTNNSPNKSQKNLSEDISQRISCKCRGQLNALIRTPSVARLFDNKYVEALTPHPSNGDSDIRNQCHHQSSLALTAGNHSTIVSCVAAPITVLPDKFSDIAEKSGKDNRVAAAMLRARLTAKNTNRTMISPPPQAKDFSTLLPHPPIHIFDVQGLTQVPMLIPESVPVPPPCPADFDVTFLGTGSATPSKHRSGTAILLRLPKTSPGLRTSSNSCGIVDVDDPCSILLDAGEGVCRQLFQTVGGDESRFNTALLGISVVWLSHHHADHTCGLSHLVECVYRARWIERNRYKTSFHCNNNSVDRDEDFFSERPRLRSPVLVFAPSAAMSYLQFALTIAGVDDIVTLRPVTDTLYAGATSAVLTATGGRLRRLRSVPVVHCRESFGAILELGNGMKVVYSGDGRPSMALAAAGRHCDLLIHEATFADNCADHAVRKKHCTVSEALAVASAMKVRGVTVLTHFSQRYAATTALTVDVQPERKSNKNEEIDMHLAVCNDLGGGRVVAAVDFLRFSFPTQAMVAPEATQLLEGYVRTIRSFSRDGNVSGIALGCEDEDENVDNACASSVNAIQVVAASSSIDQGF